MKSLRTKIMTLSMVCVVVSILTSTLIGLVIIRKTIMDDTRDIMTLSCEKYADELNNILDDMAKSVTAIEYYATSNIKNDPRVLTNATKFEDFVMRVSVIAQNEADNTNGVMGTYMRFIPEIQGNTAGFFIIRPSGETEFKPTQITDLSKYDKDDTENVGWFYPIIEAGEPLWLAPYYKQNVDATMISYVAPIMLDDKPIGVIGMDIDLDVIQDKIRKVNIYETGRAFLVDESGQPIFQYRVVEGHDITIFSKQIKRILGPNTGKNDVDFHTYHWGNAKWYLITRTLNNGMRFALTVEDGVIRAPEKQMIHTLLVAIVGLIVFSFVLTNYTTKLIIRPIWQLTHAANKIAKGELDVKLDYKGKDEIGLLTNCFKETAQELKHYMDTMNELAYHDALTGALNKTAYEERISKIDRSIKDKDAAFGVVVFDVNNLKKTNDTFGHEIGDKLILDAVHTIQKIFGNKNVYRIGGDEFTAILTGAELFTCKELVQAFDEEVRAVDITEWKDYDVSFQVARGLMVYDANEDETFADVFRRADHCMYENKRYLKGIREEK